LVIFKAEKFELHKKVKALALELDESMNSFIVAAIEERIARIEAKQK